MYQGVSAQDAPLKDSVPHRKYVYIHLISQDSDQVLFTSIGRYLSDHNYPIATSNKEFLTMRSEYGPGPGSSQMCFEITIRGHEAKVKMLMLIPGVYLGEEVFYTIHSTISKYFWDIGYKLLMSYPHSSAYYSLQ